MGYDRRMLHEKILQLAALQVSLFRVAFLLERMCPLATGLGSTFNETVCSRSIPPWQ